MKQLLILFLLVVGVNVANAQYTSSAQPSGYGKIWESFTMLFYTSGDDTATNADVLRMGAYFSHKYDINIKVVSTKVSGTVAGSIWIRVSDDGTNWRDICQGETKSYKDTATMADATTTYTWQFTADEIGSKYVEVYYNQTGTCVTAPVATIYYRKPENN